MRAAFRTIPTILFLLSGSVATTALAQGLAGRAQPSLGTVSLDNLALKGKDGETLTLKKVDVTATNLSKDDIAKLLNPDTPKDVSTALAAKMKASKFAVPEAVMVGKDVNLTLRDLVVTDIDAGKVGGFSFGGFEGTTSGKDGEVALKSGPIVLKGLNLSRVIAGVSSGKMIDSSMQLGSISWKGFEVSFPDKDTPASTPGGNIVKVSIGSITGENAYDGDVPVKSSGKVEHVVVELPKGSTGAQQMAAFGIDKIDVGMTVAGSYDKNKKAYALDDYSLDAANAGSLALKALVGGIDPMVFTGDSKTRLAGLMGADLSTLSINYADKGLFPKVIAFFATSQGKTVDALKTEWSAMATQFLPLVLGGDPSSIKLATAIGKFIGDPKSLTITAKAKGGPVKATDLMSIKDPKALLQKIDLDATAGP